jgi:uncharacterized protein with PQ loop repeat
MNGGLHHLHARKRLYKYLEPFPASTRFKKTLDYLMYVVGVVQPIALVPQISNIYVAHHVAGLSPLTWALLTVFNLLWALYGYVHKEKVILIANFLIALADIAIVLGIFLYS